MVEVYNTQFVVKQTTNSVTLTDVTRGDYDEASLVLDEPPRASFTVHDPSGVLAQSLLKEGKEFEIRRGVNGTTGERRFLGIIETPEVVDDEQGGHITIRGVHKGYAMLRQHMTDTYDYDEDGAAITTRDAVTVNPWRFFIARKTGGDLDVRGEPLPLRGITFDNVFKHIIGTKFIHQIDCTDNSYFRGSQVYATTNAAQVYRDGPSGDLRPFLQRLRSSATGFAAGSSIDTIPLENGSPNIDVMGDITQVTVRLIGILAGSQNPTVAVTRNARHATPTYSTGETETAVNILEDDAVTDTGMDIWTYTFTSGELPNTADKNSLGVKITFAGSAGDSTTTKIQYIEVECITASDTGISEGTIDAYNNPVALRTGDIDPGDWVETDLSTAKNRLEAAEMLRRLTESASSNPSPHWDAWIDANLAFHFKERRGAAITGHDYSFAAGNLRTISHRFIGTELAYQTVAYGAGSGDAQTRIVSKAEFSAGGLYDSANDPAVTATYGNLPRVLRFVDANEVSPTNLLRKARAFHKLHRAPIESIEVEIEPEHIRFFDVGDSITIKNIRTRTTGAKRVVALRRSWDGSSMEKLRVTLGEPIDDFARDNAVQGQRHETLVIRGQPGSATSGVTGGGVHATKDYYGVFAFAIPDGVPVDRVALKITTVPWQITSRGGASPDNVNHEHDSLVTGTKPTQAFESWVNVRIYNIVGGTYTSAKMRVLLSVGTTPPDETFVWDDGATVLAAASDRITTHKHPPEFGIWQFDGDAGTGTGNPIYGSGIKLAVDPTVSAAGIPTTFSTQRHPITFGSRTASVSEEVDVTGYLSTDANGVIKVGEHRVFFIATADTDNAQGLASLRVTPIIKFKQVS